MSHQPPEGFNAKWLFQDPLIEEEEFKDLRGPVLIAREIKQYVLKYKLLFDEQFIEDNIKGASYYMTPDPNNNAWRFNEKGEKVYLKIGVERNNYGGNLQYYEIPKNSLVYIRLHQKLRLPFYIIGRFNLQVTYAYKGLLLGTGPQIDPGYFDRYVNIPLHNFTKDIMKVYLHKPFVTIDFVRTSALKLPSRLPESLEAFLNEPCWENLRRALRPLPLPKYKREEIEHYVGDDRPQSSLQQLVIDLEENRSAFEDIRSKMKYDVYAVLIALAINIVSIIGLYFAMYYHFDGKLNNKVAEIKKETGIVYLNRFNGELLEVKKSINKLFVENEIANREDKKALEGLENRIKNVENETNKKKAK